MNKFAIFATPNILLKTHNPFSFCFFSSISSEIPTLATCIESLQSCAQQNNLERGRQLHAYILKHVHILDSPKSTTSLINMYSKCNSISNALNVFFTSPQTNVYSYNAIIASLISHDLPNRAFEFYSKMRVDGIVPDKYTFPCVLKACLDAVDVKKIHGLVFKLGLDSDLYIGSSSVHCYLKFGSAGDALNVFDDLPERNDVVLWNALINGFSQIQEFDKGIEVFRRMIENGVLPNRNTVTGILSCLGMMGKLYNGREVHCYTIKMGYDSGIAVLNALIDMYGKCKCVDESLEIFEAMDERDIFSWNSIICVHGQCKDHEQALRLFVRMLHDGIMPDLVTISSVLPSCAQSAALMHGKEIHAHMIVNGWIGDYRIFDDKFIDNAVMDMYAKCGSLREAHFIFDRMRCKDVASWNIMMKGYGMHGYGKEALDMFYRLCETGMKPDDVTFVGILSACSHAGLVIQGRKFFAEMQPKYGIVPAIEHYTCMIDMLGRAGLLDEAYQLLLTMPIEQNSVVWRAFLAACRLHGNADLADIAAQRVLDLGPEHCGSYVIMSNIYGAAGRYEEVQDVRHTMRQQNVKKTPGRSWI